MYGYDKKELLNFITDIFSQHSISLGCLAGEPYNLPGYLGQGISRTAFSFKQYPNIVFKICIGEDGDICYDEGELETERWEAAIEEDVAYYFAETEYLGNISLCGDMWKEDEDDCGEYVIDYSRTYDVPVYIQAKVDSTWENYGAKYDIEEQGKKALSREKKISKNLGDAWISEVDNDKLFVALFLRKYGIKEYYRLAQFIEDHHITDLHSANWGVKDGDLVIIDYAMY